MVLSTALEHSAGLDDEYGCQSTTEWRVFPINDSHLFQAHEPCDIQGQLPILFQDILYIPLI